MGGLSLHATTPCTTNSTTRCYSFCPITLSSLAQTAVTLEISTTVAKHVFFSHCLQDARLPFFLFPLPSRAMYVRPYTTTTFQNRTRSTKTKIRYPLTKFFQVTFSQINLFAHSRSFLLLRHEFHPITMTEENKTTVERVSFKEMGYRSHHHQLSEIITEKQPDRSR